MGTIDIKRVQKRLLEMAVAISEILERNNIPYQIAFGTLLGAVRHGGFIPWDDDFDFFLFDNTYDAAIELLRKELPKDMFLEDEKSEPKYFHSWAHVKDINSECICEKFPHDSNYTHRGISVDLYRLNKINPKYFSNFRYDNAINYIAKRKSLGLISNEDFLTRKKMYDERKKSDIVDTTDDCIFAYPFDIGHQFVSDVLPLKKYKFENYEFYGPANPKNILSMRYGDYMELPPMEYRIPHFSSVIFYK